LTTLQVVELCHLSQLLIHGGIMFVQQTTSSYLLTWQDIFILVEAVHVVKIKILIHCSPN